MEVATSGFGAISATTTRSSRFVLWVARAKSSSQSKLSSKKMNYFSQGSLLLQSHVRENMDSLTFHKSCSTSWESETRAALSCDPGRPGYLCRHRSLPRSFFIYLLRGDPALKFAREPVARPQKSMIVFASAIAPSASPRVYSFPGYPSAKPFG